MADPSDSNRAPVRQTGTVTVPLPRLDAFQLFTPEGERRWVPDWAPEYLHGDGARCRPGLAFRTQHGDEETLWLVLDYDAAGCRARYARVTPGSRMGTVAVAATTGPDPAVTAVEVTYELTALSDAGREALRGFGDDEFAAMLVQWRQWIEAALREGR